VTAVFLLKRELPIQHLQYISIGHFEMKNIFTERRKATLFPKPLPLQAKVDAGTV